MNSLSQEKPVVLGLIGYGTVGQGFVRLLRKETNLLGRRLGFPLFLKTVVDRNIKEKSSGLLDGVVLSHDPASVINDPEIQIVIELIGGIEPARSLLLEAVRKKKSVVTANKALLALHGEELFQAVHSNRTDFAFEGSVGGGIPILRSLREGIGGNRIQSLRGIINGTCNYILTRMTYERQDFETVLREAQALGYAEADPSFDIDGIDAAHKLAILGTLSFGSPIAFQDIPVEGIRKVQTIDIEFGRELGYVLKLLGIAKDDGASLDLRVMSPTSCLAAPPRTGSHTVLLHVVGSQAFPSISMGLTACRRRGCEL